MSIISDVLTDMRKLDQGPAVMRKFGFVLGFVLLLISAIPCYKNWDGAFQITPAMVALWICAGLSFVIAVVAPGLLKSLNTLMVFIGMIIGWFVTRIVLSLLFFLVFFPTGLIMKILGRDTMARKMDSGAESYWILRSDTSFDPKQCRRLF